MKNQNFSPRLYDIAYGSFMFCGMVALAIGGLSYIPMDSGTAGALGFLVFIPLSMASLAAIVVGIVLSIILFRHWQLIVLSILSVLFIVEMFTEAGPVVFYNLTPIVYGISTFIFSYAWFGVLRKRYKNA